MVSSGTTLPVPPPATGDRAHPVMPWNSHLPHPIVIADRRDNRLIEVAPDRRIVWQLPSPDLKIYRGNDDVFFSAVGHRPLANEEDNFDIHIVDYRTRALGRTFGASDTRGSAPGWLVHPDGPDTDLFQDWRAAPAERLVSRLSTPPAGPR